MPLRVAVELLIVWHRCRNLPARVYARVTRPTPEFCVTLNLSGTDPLVILRTYCYKTGALR